VTALGRRRTRNTRIGLVAAVLGFVAASVLGVSGVRSLADSKAGRQAEGQATSLPAQRLPFTATALVGVVDEDGRLTTVAAWVLEPTGVGGSIVGLAASADSASGTFDTLAPLAAVFQVSGPDEFLAAAERLTGLSFDVIEVVDEARFAQLVGPLGDLPASFDVPFVDASSQESWDAGETILSSPAVARAITATDPEIADWYFESGRAAVWQAIADRVGAGIGTLTPIASDDDVPIPRTLDEFADRLFAAPVAFRALGFIPVETERVDEQLLDAYVGALGPVDVVVTHDRAELAIVLGAVAPGRLGAPYDAPVFRVVSHYTGDDLDGLGLNVADVLKRAVDRLFFAQVNVVSVADIPDAEVPEVTQVVVADPAVVDAVRTTYALLFGEIEIVPADVRIDGIDIEVTLGRTFLEELRGDSDPTVAGSVGNADAQEQSESSG
jgi:hypothetical protein